MKQPYPPRSADEDSWINAESSSEGNPKLLRIRPDLEHFDGKQSFQKKIVFTWDYGNAQELSGLPSDDQSDGMRPFEDTLVVSLEDTRHAIFAYAHSGQGIRKWHFYIAGLKAIKTDLDCVLNRFPGLPLKIEVYDDPEWKEYLDWSIIWQ